MGAENVGRMLEGCRWVGVLFAGGMCELTPSEPPAAEISTQEGQIAERLIASQVAVAKQMQPEPPAAANKPKGNYMTDEEIIGRIHNELSVKEVQHWFLASQHDIRDVVLSVAKADGIDAATKEVRRLYVAWIDASSKLPPAAAEGGEN